jgi:hypothetical protein
MKEQGKGIRESSRNLKIHFLVPLFGKEGAGEIFSQ